MKLTVKPSQENQRLDKFLSAKVVSQSRSAIQKMIKAGAVLVNGRPTSVHQSLRAGDVIEVTAADPISAEQPRPDQEPLEPRIVADEKDFLIIEKPAGLLVHPTQRNETDTLVDWVVKQYPAVTQVGESQYRAGIIHRLDRDVSGVMVIPKNNQLFDHLKTQFKNRQIKKEYRALVYGHIAEQQGEIDLPIGRNKTGLFVAHPRQGKDKFQSTDRIAKTQFTVLEYLKDYTLLSVTLLTGRTHQIRAHLFAIGHPIVGDRLYKTKKKFFHFLRRKIKVVDPGRIFLHSTSIGFHDLNNQWQEFTVPLPTTLTAFLNELK